MRRAVVRRSAGVLLAALVLGSLLSLGGAGTAQTTRQVGHCIADAGGNIPAPNIPCNAKIPNDTLPGEYTLRANGNGPPGSGPSYPPQQGTLGVGNNRLCAGQETSVTGSGFLPNSVVTLTLERVGALATAGLGLGGAAQAQEVVRTLTARVTVVDCRNVSTAAGTNPAGTTTGRPLSPTGMDVLRWLLIGGSLVGVGVALVSFGRRRMRGEDAATQS